MNMTVFDVDIGGLRRACSRVHELAAAIWLQRARVIAGDDLSAWSAFLASVGIADEVARCYERELEIAKARGEPMPCPPLPKEFKRLVAKDKLQLIATSTINALASELDPSGRRGVAPAPEVAPLVARSAPVTVRQPAREQRVYFIQGVSGGPIKIGTSLDPDERLKTLQTASPVRLRIIGLVRGGPALESALHKRLAEHRLHGEWFTDASDVLAAISEILQ